MGCRLPEHLAHNCSTKLQYTVLTEFFGICIAAIPCKNTGGSVLNSSRLSSCLRDCFHPCREAAALKAALRKNEALLHGLNTAHELADVVATDAQVLGLPQACVPGRKTATSPVARSSPARCQRFRFSCQASPSLVTSLCVHALSGIACRQKTPTSQCDGRR